MLVRGDDLPKLLYLELVLRQVVTLNYWNNIYYLFTFPAQSGESGTGCHGTMGRAALLRYVTRDMERTDAVSVNGNVGAIPY